jgi:aldehyde dehydrogenase (NAD+)
MAPAPSVETHAILDQLGVPRADWAGGPLIARSPITGEELAALAQDDAASARAKIDAAHRAFLAWRRVPGPRRGELVRLFGEELRAHKESLARLVTIEAGKVLSEGRGEVQEMIDICDFAAGLSRQLYGLTLTTERANHRMMET